MLTVLGVVLGSWWPSWNQLGTGKEMIHCKESCSENIVTDDLGLHRLLPLGNFLLVLVLTFGLKKPMKVDGLILTKLLIFYRTGVSCQVQKIHVFCKGKSAGSMLLWLNVYQRHYISSISGQPFIQNLLAPACNFFQNFNQFVYMLFCFNLLTAKASLQFSDQNHTISQCSRALRGDLIWFWDNQVALVYFCSRILCSFAARPVFPP